MDGRTGALSQQACPCLGKLTATFTDGSGVPEPTIASRGLGISPDGLQWADIEGGGVTRTVRITGSTTTKDRPGRTWPVTANEPITGVHLLGWTGAGRVLAVDSSNGLAKRHSIRVMEPETGESAVVSRPHETSVPVPVAMAAGLVISADPIAAPRPFFDQRDRSHLVFLAVVGWSWYGNLIKAGLVLVALAAAGMVLWRRRRRAAPVP